MVDAEKVLLPVSLLSGETSELLRPMETGPDSLSVAGAAKEAVMREERANGRMGEIFMLRRMSGFGGRVIST